MDHEVRSILSHMEADIKRLYSLLNNNNPESEPQYSADRTIAVEVETHGSEEVFRQ